MTITTGDREIRNAIGEAIYVVLGGVRPAAERLKVSTQAVYQLLGAEVVKNRDTALKIARETAALGREVPAAELMDLAPWTGPTRRGPGPQGRKGGRKHPKALASLPIAGDDASSTGATEVPLSSGVANLGTRLARVVRPQRPSRAWITSPRRRTAA